MGIKVYNGLNYNHACYKLHIVLGEERVKNLELKFSDNLVRVGFYLNNKQIAYYDNAKNKLVIDYRKID